MGQDILHNRLRQQDGPLDMRGFKFLPAADVHHANAARAG